MSRSVTGRAERDVSLEEGEYRRDGEGPQSRRDGSAHHREDRREGHRGQGERDGAWRDRHRSRSRTRSRSPPRRHYHREKDEQCGRERGTSRERDRDVKWKERSRSRSRDRPRSHEHRHRRRRSRSHSRAGSEDDSSSSSSSRSDSEDERRRRKRRRRREEKEERRRKKERKREKKARKGKGTAASTGQWGKYGLISETDISSKDSEFRTWLVEERKINPETISKDRSRKEFAVFVEDYNTATFPSEKYYDMGKYEIKMNLIRSGQSVPTEGSYDPLADMRAHSSLLKAQAGPKESTLSRSEIAELRRLESERIEVGKRRQLGLDVPKHLGVRTEVNNFDFDG